MLSITLPIESNSSTVKHTASCVTLHKNMFGVKCLPDVLVNVSGLMRVKAHYYITRTCIQLWGTNYFSLFVSYRFTSNKTQLTEFPESKSDMP